MKFHKRCAYVWSATYSCFIEGVRDVIVVIVGNGHGDTSSNPRPGWMHFT